MTESGNFYRATLIFGVVRSLRCLSVMLAYCVESTKLAIKLFNHLVAPSF